MQAGGGLVEDVQRAPGVALGQLARQLDALRLAARQRGGRLTELDVRQPDVEQRLQLARDGRHVLEEGGGVFHRQLQDLRDVLALPQHFQRLAVVALALADVAGHVDVRQEVHLDLDHAVALAGLAAAALDVEAEAPRLVAARARLGGAGEQFADRREQPGVGGRVGARACGRSALWSISMTLSKCSRPSMSSWSPAESGWRR